jgi:hypothetical protein
MVSVGYLIDKPAAPSALRRFVNQRVIPQAIDAAGVVESAAYELGEQVRRRPGASLAVAALLGFAVGGAVFRAARAG